MTAIDTHSLFKLITDSGMSETQAEIFITHFVTREEFEKYKLKTQEYISRLEKLLKKNK